MRTWTSEDAWILASLAKGRGLDLSEVIAGADAANHSVPSREELSSSLGALIGCGFVEVRGGRFWLTKEGNRIRKHWKGGMFAWASMLPELEKSGRPVERFPLEQSEVDQAYKDYSARFAKTLRRMRRFGL